MITPKVGFIVYGVHKDGLLDPMGTPFIDDALIDAAKDALRAAGLELVEHDVILATKAEARACFARYKQMDDLDAVILFSGTWVWAGHLVAALRDFTGTGKGILLWTNPGSQGWRPVRQEAECCRSSWPAGLRGPVPAAPAMHGSVDGRAAGMRSCREIDFAACAYLWLRSAILRGRGASAQTCWT